MLQVEWLGYMGDAVRRNGNVFGIEAALRIVPAICVDAIAGLEPADTRSHSSDGTRAVTAKDKRIMGAAAAR
jgi:hypothetical protein